MSTSTKDDIASALKELLEEKPLPKISISEITERCHISRITFYYHFSNMNDLLIWNTKRECARSIYFCNDPRKWDQKVTAFCSVLYDNRNIMDNIISHLKHKDIVRYIHMTIQDILENAMSAFCGDHATHNRIGFISGFYAHAVTGMIDDWLDEGLERTPEDLVNSFYSVVHDAITSEMGSE